MTANSSSLLVPNNDFALLDYTEIDQGLNLWSEILPMIEKQIVTLTTVAQEMQECPDRQKYVDALMKIAVRVNDVEDKATTCIKEARTQLKKKKLINQSNDTQEKSRHHGSDEEENSDEEEEQMDIDESQIEISALNTESLEKLQESLQNALAKQPDPNAFDIDADNRYADFAECLSKMQGNEEEDDDEVDSNKCPLTHKAFIEPVQNKTCKHRYEKKAILKYLSDKNKARRPAQCPSDGCENIVHEKDLITA